MKANSSNGGVLNVPDVMLLLAGGGRSNGLALSLEAINQLSQRQRGRERRERRGGRSPGEMRVNADPVMKKSKTKSGWSLDTK